MVDLNTIRDQVKDVQDLEDQRQRRALPQVLAGAQARPDADAGRVLEDRARGRGRHCAGRDDRIRHLRIDAGVADVNGDEAPELHYFAVKTTSKQERTVADNIRKAVEQSDIKVYAVMAPKELQGYVLIETPEPFARMEELVERVPHARAVVHGETSFAEIQHFLVPKPVVSGINEGTIVELIAGPFKGEKAVVKRVDTGKGGDHGRALRVRGPDPDHGPRRQRPRDRQLRARGLTPSLPPGSFLLFHQP